MSRRTDQDQSLAIGLLRMLQRSLLSLAIFTAFVLVAAVALRPWYDRWGATEAEAQMPLPGDELIPDAARQLTLGITVQAPPEAVWPWLAQLGAGRGGLYSYSWFERLMNCPVQNASQVIPGLQNPQVGDPVKLCPGDFGPPPFEIAELQPGRAFIAGGRDASGTAWDGTNQYVLLPQDGGATRLLLRNRSAGSSAFDTLLGPGIFIMERRMLQGLRERAEGQMRPEWQGEAEILLWLAAFFGFLAAEAGLVLRRDWKRPAVLAVCAALATLFLAFVQPPLWVDVLGLLAVCAGLVWAFRPAKRTPIGHPVQAAG